jgi:hypothetical protein
MKSNESGAEASLMTDVLFRPLSAAAMAFSVCDLQHVGQWWP